MTPNHDLSEEPRPVGSQAAIDGLDNLTGQQVIASETDRHLMRLAALYPGIVAFRLGELQNMDEATKQFLLQDINALLGVKLAIPKTT